MTDSETKLLVVHALTNRTRQFLWAYVVFSPLHDLLIYTLETIIPLHIITLSIKEESWFSG